jgi:aubergine-like protein
MIKNGCLKACNKLPKITYVALNRKSNVKMFYDSSSKGAQYENCPPGTVIDEVVVEDQLSDFYLITQKTTQGVAQPVHYYLVYDDYEVNPTQLYSLIYKLCYMYFNWTGSIKIPAPCQYVKKLTQMTGEKLSDKSYMCRPNVRFENELKTLYFL